MKLGYWDSAGDVMWMHWWCQVVGWCTYLGWWGRWRGVGTVFVAPGGILVPLQVAQVTILLLNLAEE